LHISLFKAFYLKIYYTFMQMTFTFNTNLSAGFMFHGKPLYVALAQRKEDRQAQLQLQYAQQIAGLAGPSTAIVHGEYPPFYYTATGVVSHAPPRAGLMYQPMALRPGWRANGSAPPARSFQQSPAPVVSNNFDSK
jgi:polyadenylate-binding protein